MAVTDVANLVSPVSTGAPVVEAEAPTEKVTKKSEKSELEKAELELKKLEIIEKRANIEDLTERLDERKNRRLAVRMTSVTNGQTLNAIAKEQEQSQRRCNHRKGGNGAAGVMSGQGDSLWFALMKHRMLNGDIWIRCMRCGKTWKPPVRRMFADETKYQVAVAEYEAAKLMPTNNSPSSSYAFSFSDGGQYFREVTASTNLR